MTQQSSVIFSSISIFYHHINRRFFSLCGGHPRKVWTAKYSDKTRGLCDKDILKLVLLGPFLGYFFGQAKKWQKTNWKSNSFVKNGADGRHVSLLLLTACKRDVLFWADCRYIKFEARLKFLQEKYCNIL